jgi:hypothetical protein
MNDNGWQLPFTGDVTQSINPLSLWVKGGQQLGFVNINASSAGDPQLERDIVEGVASYGRQLGRVIDALDVLVSHLPEGERLTSPEKDALHAFGDLVAHIEAAKSDAGDPALTMARLDRTIESVQGLRRSDRPLYDQMVGRIRGAFGEV